MWTMPQNMVGVAQPQPPVGAGGWMDWVQIPWRDEVSQLCLSLAAPTDADVEAAVRFATAVKASPAATAGDVNEAVAYEAQVVTAGNNLMSENP